jgi:hypothetical protein
MVITLRAKQECYFGYGATRPRRGERSQCVAFQTNKMAKGWRTAKALHEGVTTICGESQAGRQRAQEILARRTDSGFSCKNCFECALKQAQAAAAGCCSCCSRCRQPRGPGGGCHSGIVVAGPLRQHIWCLAGGGRGPCWRAGGGVAAGAPGLRLRA